jgi:16S rRNA (guanine527-N7)-methyltransferase
LSVSREIIDLDGLAKRYGLSDSQQRQLAAVLTHLAQDERAPTSVRDPARILDVHLADSLVAMELDVVRSAAKLADIGAGAGLPGLALAVALPRCEVRLVESQARKCAFMKRLCAGAEIANAQVVCTRVEQWAHGAEDHDVVVARALAAQPVALEYAAPPLRVGGTLVDWRGARDAAEESAASIAAYELGLRLAEIRRVEPYEGVREHHLHVYVKELPTPSRFPRRAGIARKRPLGGATAARSDGDRR